VTLLEYLDRRHDRRRDRRNDATLQSCLRFWLIVALVAAILTIILTPVIVTGWLGKSVPEALIASADKAATGLIGVLGGAFALLQRRDNPVPVPEKEEGKP